MKKYLFLLVGLMAFTFSVAAQTGNAREVTNELKAVYSLDAQQTQQMLEIQQKKNAQLTEIAPLRDTDRKTYIAKLKSIRYGTNGSIKQILNNDQLRIFRDREIEQRKKEADLLNSLKAKNADKSEIDDALIDLNN